MKIPAELHGALDRLLGELLDGPPGREAYVLNPEDRGLLGSLDKIPAADASAIGTTGSSIAAHLEHLRYGFSLMNRWASGDQNAFKHMDWKAAWQRMSVTAEEWDVRRREFRTEVARWRTVMAARQDADEMELTGIISSTVHLAYHLGAIRQIQPALRGPLA